MYDKSLPIGSVVIMHKGEKRVMIIGYYQRKADESGKIYDYVGVGFPEGFLKSDELALFNHDQIERIYSIGYQDSSWPDFQNKLINAINISDSKNGR